MNSEYVASIPIRFIEKEAATYRNWMLENRIDYMFEYGTVYLTGKIHFKSKEDALAFKLKFEI